MADKDISMDIKMGSVSFPGMKDLFEGRKIDEAQIEPLCRFVDERYDCCDFRAVVLLKAVCAFSDLLSEATLDRIKKSLLGFKYWIDESGEDSICYWSENHQLLFHTCEYIAGSLYPEDVFSNNGMTGRRHAEKAHPKILRWLEHRWKYGFIEWHSNTYYEEDIAPLALLMDHAPDEEIRKKAVTITNLLLLDMAMFSFEGYFSTTSGRCYEKQKKDGNRQDTLNIYRHAFETGTGELNYEKISSVFLTCRSYRLPPVIRAIAEDRDRAVIKDSVGLGLPELKHEFDMKDFDEGGAVAWQMEAFTNVETINLTMDMFRAWHLNTNDFLKDLKMISSPFLRKAGLLPPLVRLLNPTTAGVAIQRSNNYCLKTADYMLSTSMRYHPGEFGDQQHIWHASLPGNIHVFTTHPGAPFFDDQARNFSPDYWVGNGILPDSAQHESIHMSIYKTDVRKGFLERKRLHFTHAFFPKAKFDQVITEEKAVYGRAGDSYIALLAPKALEWKDDEEIVQPGALTAWVCRLSSARDSGSFEGFIREAGSEPLTFKRLKLAYGGLSLEYKKGFRVNGKAVSRDYKRLEAPWAVIERKPEEFHLAWKGHELTMRWE